MRPIAMINQKGGVGKTTTAVNVAAALARDGQRVLLVDLDPQAHATMHLGIEPAPDEPGIYDILVSGTDAAEALRETSENLTLIPAHIDLVAAELELARRPERELILRHALEPLYDRFDTLIIDCPPSLGTLTVNALAAVEEVIIPLQPHFLALQGLGRLLETVALVRDVLNPPLRIAGVVLCLYEKGTRLAQEVAADVRQFIARASPQDAWYGARVFDTAIRRNVKLAECPSFGRTIFDYAPSSHGAKDYGALAREMREMILPIIGEHTGEGGEAAGAALSATRREVLASATPGQGGAAAETCVVREARADVDKVLPAGSRAPLGDLSEGADPLAPPAASSSSAPVTPDTAP
ncbi:MAG: ParA family protein [Phycisphaerae bacterium]